MIYFMSVGKIRTKLGAKVLEVLGAAAISHVVLLDVSVVWVKSFPSYPYHVMVELAV